MKIRYYTRDEAGIMAGPRTAHGYASVSDFLSENFRDTERPEPAELLGWPDSRVVWYGDIGVVR